MALTGRELIRILSQGLTGVFTNPAVEETVTTQQIADLAAGGSGITQLTGDVTAGPGSGSEVATLATVNSNVGSFTSANITVNAKGLVTAAANGSGGSVPPSPFFGTALIDGWTRPGLDIGGSTPNCFTKWLNQGGQALGVGTDSPPTNGAPTAPGTGAVPGQIDTLGGGTLLGAGNLPVPAATQITITDTQVITVAINGVGSGGTPGPATLTGTTGTGSMFQCTVVIQGDGTLTGAPAPVLTVPGDYTANPISLSAEPVTSDDAGPLTGATLTLTMGALLGAVTRVGGYATPPANPVAGSNGRTWTVGYSTLATVSCASGNSPVTANKTAVPIVVSVRTDAGESAGYLTAALIPIGAAPWTITVGEAISAFLNGAPILINAAPLVLYDSVSDVAICLFWSPSGYVAVWDYSSTTPGIAPALGTVFGMSGSYFSWFSVVNNGSTVAFSSSNENLLYNPGESRSAIAFDYIGVGVDRAIDEGGTSKTAGDSVSNVIWNWVQTSP